MNFMPAPTVVLPLAVVPSFKEISRHTIHGIYEIYVLFTQRKFPHKTTSIQAHSLTSRVNLPSDLSLPIISCDDGTFTMFPEHSSGTAP
jgi:hypothetical protein